MYFDASVEVNGTFYAFDGILTGFSGGFPAGVSELDKVDLTTGAATFIRVVDGGVGVILGAAPAEPWSPSNTSHSISTDLRTGR